MSVFNNLVKSAVLDGATTVFLRDVHPSFVLPEEERLYQFVMSHLRRYGNLPSESSLQIAGHSLSGEISESTQYYLDRIKSRYVFNAINTLHPSLTEAMRTRDTSQAMELLRQMVSDASLGQAYGAVTTLAQESQRVLDEYQQRKWRGGLAGIPTGWTALDVMTRGALGGDVIVFAGRPSMGKSWALIWAAFQAWRAGYSIGFGSMEMSKSQIVRRWMGLHLGVNPNFIKEGQVSTWTESMLRNYPDNVSARPAVSFLGGDMEKSVDSLEALLQEQLPDALYVDAAYLLTPAGRQHGYISRWESISNVMRELKKLAIKYDRPIFITVQFNRNIKNDTTKELDLSDIGGSDSISQDASVVVGMRKGLPPFESMRRRKTVLKNRDGETGEFATHFSFTPPDFSEVVDDQENQARPTDMGWML